MGLGAFGVRAQPSEPAARPPGVELSVERCEGAPFDLAAYAQAVEVELAVLKAAALVPGSAPEGARGPQLDVRVPGCGDALAVTLRVRDAEAGDALRASDYPGVGQPRALALATIETMRVLSLRLQAGTADGGTPAETAAAVPAASAPPREPEPATAAEAAAAVPAVSAPPREPERAATEPTRASPTWLVLVRGGLGAGSGWDAQLLGGAALGVLPRAWLRAELGYGHASDRTALGALTASGALLGVSLELRALELGSVVVVVAGGLRGALAFVRGDWERLLAPGLAARGVVATWLGAVLALDARVRLGGGSWLGAFVEPGYALAGARITGATAEQLASSELAGSDPPRLALLGLSVHGGLTFGYEF